MSLEDKDEEAKRLALDHYLRERRRTDAVGFLKWIVIVFLVLWALGKLTAR